MPVTYTFNKFIYVAPNIFFPCFLLMFPLKLHLIVHNSAKLDVVLYALR